MSISQRTSRHKTYNNYTPAQFQASNQSAYQQSYRASSYLQPTQQQQEEEQNNIIPKPINVPTLQEQDQLFVSNAFAINQNHQYTYNAVSGTGKQGASVKKRVEMGLLSGIEEEISYALKTLTEFSFSDPKVFAFKDNAYILHSLIGYLDYGESTKASSKNLSYALDAALALRNFSQVIENSAVMSMNGSLKEILIQILNGSISSSLSVGDDAFEAFAELLRYALDIVESISSYLSPAPKDDALFVTLLSMLTKSEDRYIIISILRSLSRLLVRTTADIPSSAENITSKVLDQASGYLLAASPLAVPDAGNDELLLASIDFLYQYCLAGEERIATLFKSEKRAILLRTILPKLLTHGLSDVPTETSDRLAKGRVLKLVKRVKRPTPTSAPKLTEELGAEVNALDEPERATAWMRCCYEPTIKGEVTQISLWKSYESQFGHPTEEGEITKRLLPAVDFIKNVSNAFPHSSAKVLTQEGGTKKFVIKGIQPRQFPASIDTGNTDATAAPEPEEDSEQPEDEIDENLVTAQQAQFKLLNYGENEKISANEINTSSALLINCFVKTEMGNKIFEGCKDELLGKVLIVPALFSHIYETLKYLDY